MRLHETLFKKFNQLRDTVKSSCNPIFHDHRCLIHHVAAVYNHTASQGYQPNIHYQPLCDAVQNWCYKRAVDHWNAPPDQHSRSASPVLPPDPPANHAANLGPKRAANPPAAPRPTVARPPSMTVTPAPPSKPAATKPDKGKGKQTAKAAQAKPPPTSPEFIEEDDDEVKPDPPPKTLPPTDDFEEHDPKCNRCHKIQHGCHVNPNGTSAAATACFECNHYKVRCSLVPGPSRSSAKDESEVPKKPRGGRKKLIVVPAGEPGQYGGAFLIFFFCLLF